MSLPNVAYSGIAYFGQNVCHCGIWRTVVTAYFGQNVSPCGISLIVVTAYFGQNVCHCDIWRTVVTAYFRQNVCPCDIWLIVVTAYFQQNVRPCPIWLIVVINCLLSTKCPFLGVPRLVQILEIDGFFLMSIESSNTVSYYKRCCMSCKQ